MFVFENIFLHFRWFPLPASIMNGSPRNETDANDDSGDKWSDTESDEEFISSELRTDTGK